VKTARQKIAGACIILAAAASGSPLFTQPGFTRIVGRAAGDPRNSDTIAKMSPLMWKHRWVSA
jgi:hypothetical protein